MAASDSLNQWTLHENKVFEDAIAESPELFMRGQWHEIAKMIPSKTAEEIKLHYEHHEEDTKMMESGYPDGRYTQEELEEDIRKILEGSIRPPFSLRPPKEEGLEEALRERGYELEKTTQLN